MKGVVFTEFLEMVEERFSPETADRIIEASNLSTDGAYTAVGTYDYEELAQLVNHLSAETGIAAAELLRSFGHRLFQHFHRGYNTFFDGIDSSFDFLKKVESYIHVEVRKLYHDAEIKGPGHSGHSIRQPTSIEGCLEPEAADRFLEIVADIDRAA